MYELGTSACMALRCEYQPGFCGVHRRATTTKAEGPSKTARELGLLHLVGEHHEDLLPLPELLADGFLRMKERRLFLVDVFA